jgi:hypothetical protein
VPPLQGNRTSHRRTDAGIWRQTKFHSIQFLRKPRKPALSSQTRHNGNAYRPIPLWRKACQQWCKRPSKRRPWTDNRVHHQETERLHQKKHTSEAVIYLITKTAIHPQKFGNSREKKKTFPNSWTPLTLWLLQLEMQ